MRSKVATDYLIGTIVGVFFTQNILFKITFAITYFAIAWICIEAFRISELRNLIKRSLSARCMPAKTAVIRSPSAGAEFDAAMLDRNQ